MLTRRGGNLQPVDASLSLMRDGRFRLVEGFKLQLLTVALVGSPQNQTESRLCSEDRPIRCEAPRRCPAAARQSGGHVPSAETALRELYPYHCALVRTQ